MPIAGEDPPGGFHANKATHPDILPDLRDQALPSLFNRGVFTVAQRLLQQGGDVTCALVSARAATASANDAKFSSLATKSVRN